MAIKTAFPELLEIMTPETFEKVLEEMEHFSELIHLTNQSFLSGAINEKEVALALHVLDQWCSKIMLILHWHKNAWKAYGADKYGRRSVSGKQ
jgi:hypothetical protein